MTKYRTATPMSQSSHYHDSEDCSAIKGETKEISESLIEWHGLEPCSRCHGGVEVEQMDRSYYDAAKNHD